MDITILVFGSLADITGANKISVTLEKDTASLLEKMIVMYPLLNNRKFTIAVDKKIINENTIIHSSSEIALLPPFSGG